LSGPDPDPDPDPDPFFFFFLFFYSSALLYTHTLPQEENKG
jgi:hypothetical protein